VPPEDLEKVLTSSPRLAFQINPALPEVRREGNLSGVRGVEQAVWGKPYNGELGPLPRKTAAAPPKEAPPHTKVVDPSVSMGGSGTYRTLGQAVTDAKPGDVILIRHNGLLRVEPVRLEKAAIDLTIKPVAGFHPILKLDETAEYEPALFRLHDGQLRLEQLELLLKPGRREFRNQAVVVVAGVGQCSLKNCVVTLDDGGVEGVPLDVLALADPKDVMKMDRPQDGRKAPELSLDGCFVRGTGDLLEVRASQPFSFSAHNSLVVLNGSFVRVEGKSDEPAMVLPGAQVTLNRLTAYLTDSLIFLRAGKNEETKNIKGLVATQITQASKCLFAAPREGKALVHLDGLDDLTDEQQLKKLFGWAGENNVYSNFVTMLDHQPRGDGMALGRFDGKKWREVFDETDPHFARLKFQAPLERLTRALPTQFKLKAESAYTAVGVDLDQLIDHLPRHFLTREPEPAEDKAEGPSDNQ
jgi:hypothetical protein